MTLAALGTLRDGVLHLYAALTARSLDGIPFRDETLPDPLTVDGQALQQADSIGVAALVWLAGQAQQQQRRTTWQHLPPHLGELLALYEIDLPTMSQPNYEIGRASCRERV